MKMNWKKNLLGFSAIAVVFMMIGAGITLTVNPTAQAENGTAAATTVVTSPFTSAIASVRDSVVGVSNYQMVRYSNSYGSNSWQDFFGFGNGYGNNYGSDGNDATQSQEVEAATGSGVVIGEGGYVLTNFHVVEDASSLKITVSNPDAESGVDQYDATLVAYDENLDIAILQAKDLKLTPVTLGDSDTLQVGDWAICIGNPLGEQFSGTVTTGIVSALDRAVSTSSYDKYGRKETTTNTMIQTDAAINSGNSGGGMFNVAGQLMGIPTLKYSGSAYSGTTVEGIGMCIPINAAKPLIEDVLSGKVTADNANQTTTSGDTSTSSTMVGKPRMGVTITSINTNSQAVQSGALPNGVYVSEVEEGAPAATAGMQAGDIIVDVDGTVITSVTQLQSIIAEKNEGDTLNVKVYRVPGITGLTGTDDIPDGEYIDLTVTLAIVDQVKQ